MALDHTQMVATEYLLSGNYTRDKYHHLHETWPHFGKHHFLCHLKQEMPGSSQKILMGVAAGFVTAFPVWLVQMGSAGKPSTMRPAFTEAMNEYSKFQNLNPLQGISSNK